MDGSWWIAAAAATLGAPATLEGDPHARPVAVAERPDLVPGETTWVALDFEIDEGWHTYWPGLNDSGSALVVEPVMEGVALGEPLWPAPVRHVSPGDIVDHVFEERMTVLLPLIASPELKPGTEVPVQLGLKWLACERVCVMESTTLEFSLSVRNATSARPVADCEAFRLARARAPEELPEDGSVFWLWDGPTLMIECMGAGKVAFYPREDSDAPADLANTGEAEGTSLRLRFDHTDRGVVRGVLEVWAADQGSSRVYKVETLAPRARVRTPENESKQP